MEREDNKREDNKYIFKINHCLGTHEIHRIMMKNKWQGIGEPVSQKDFHIIIGTVNKLITKYFIEGHTMTLPYNLGKLELIKKKTYVDFKDGKLKTNKFVNWRETLKLWEEDDEARQDKTLIRYDLKYQIYCKYNKFRAIFKNKKFYSFKPTIRTVKKIVFNYVNNKVDGIIVNKN